MLRLTKTPGSNHQRLEKLPNLRFGFFLNSWSLKSYADHCQDASGALSSAALSPFAPKFSPAALNRLRLPAVRPDPRSR